MIERTLIPFLDATNCSYNRLVEALYACRVVHFPKDELICSNVAELIKEERHPIVDPELGIFGPAGTRAQKRLLRGLLFEYRARGCGGCRLMDSEDYPDAYVRTSKGFYFSKRLGPLRIFVGERYKRDCFDNLLFPLHSSFVVTSDRF